MRCTSAQFVLALIWAGICPPAMAEFVVVTHPENPLSSITIEQVSRLYLGVANNLVPLDQAEGSPLRQEFYKKITHKEAAQIRAIWAKLVFTGKGRIPRELASTEEVKKAIAANPNALAYIEKTAVDASVKVLLFVP